MENTYIESNFLENIKREARNSPRDRINFNFHKAEQDPIQRFINHMLPSTYVTPHRHTLGTDIETFVILKGHAVMVTFDEEGDITNTYELNPEKDKFAVEINAREYHTLMILKESTFYEIKRGPYNALTDKEFPEWAPQEGDVGVKIFKEFLNDRVMESLNLGDL